jgi:hypothetical protein
LGHKVGGIGLNVLVIQTIPRLSRWKVAAPREPVPTRETHNCEKSVANLVDDENGCVGSACSNRGLVKHHDLRKLSEEKLLVTSLLLARLACPVGDRKRVDGLANRICDSLLARTRTDRELVERILSLLARLTVVAFDGMHNPESQKLV